MTVESPLDVPYSINPRIVSSIKGSDSMIVSGAHSPLELPLALFQVLMAFAEKKTARLVFETLDLDIEIDEFGKTVSGLCDHGLLLRDRPEDDRDSLRRLLNPGVLSGDRSVEAIGRWMREGRAIIIPDALPAELAEEVHHDLCHSSHWKIAEGGHDFFHFRNSAIERLDGRSPALTRCDSLFKSMATRRFVQELSGQDCMGEAGAAAAWYRPGEYALPHDDTTASLPRSVAYIWYLTKDWQKEWGGSLFWCRTGQHILPTFNMLVMFNVLPSNLHFICPVALTAAGKRLTINGFWHRTESTPSSRSIVGPSDVVSPHLYGQPAAADPELTPFIVL